jgi:hypothetical protein
MRDDIDWAQKYKLRHQSKQLAKYARNVTQTTLENEGSSSDDSVLFPPRRHTTDNLDEFQHIFDSNECKVLSTKNFPAKLSRRSQFCHVCKYEL